MAWVMRLRPQGSVHVFLAEGMTGQYEQQMTDGNGPEALFPPVQVNRICEYWNTWCRVSRPGDLLGTFLPGG